MVPPLSQIPRTLWGVLLSLLSLSAYAQLQTATVTTTANMGNFTDVWMVDDNTGYAAGRLAIYKTTNGGATWTLLPAFNPTAGPLGTGDFDYAYMFEQHLYFTDANHGISAAWNGFYQAEEIIVTSDGGATWTVRHKINPDPAPFQAIEQRLRFLDRLASGNFITGGYRGRILLSTDGGNTWIAQTTNTTADLEDVSFIDASNGFAGGDGVILKTTNGGSTWTPTDISYHINNLKAFSATNIIATTDNGFLIKSTDGGQSWTEMFQSTESFTDIEFINNLTGFFLTENGLYKTSNAGNTFQYVQLMPTNLVATEMQALAEKKFYIATNSGKILFNNNTDLAFDYENGFYADGKSFCQNTSITFHNIGNPAYSYKWYIDDVEVAQTYDFTHTFTDAASAYHTIKLVSDNGAQPRVVSKMFDIRPQPTKPPGATFYTPLPDTVEVNTYSQLLNFPERTYGNFFQLFRNGVAVSDRQESKYYPELVLPVNNLTDPIAYDYVLVSEAVNDCGSAETETKFTIVATDKPNPVKDIDIHHEANSQVKLHWVVNSTLAPLYVVERRMEGANTWDVMAIVNSENDEKTYIDNTVTALKTYSYRVAAVNANGRRGRSPIVTTNIYDKVVYVNSAATGKNNGLTWTDAFKHINDAAPNSEADLEIWVAKGTYTHNVLPTWSIAGNGMYGGFAGGETNRDQRTIGLNQTVVDGQRSMSTIDVQENSVLDGFTITNFYTGVTTYGLVSNCKIESSAFPLTMWGQSELATTIVRNNDQGLTRFGKSKIFNSVIYNNSSYLQIFTYYQQEDGTWAPAYDPSYLRIPDLYYSLVPGAYNSMGQNTITNYMLNDKDVDGTGRPEKQLRILDYLSGEDGVAGNDDDIYHWPDAGLIDKGMMNDPAVYSQSKGFSKDLEGNARIFNGIPDVGPIEYGPDAFPLPQAPTVAYRADEKSTEVLWSEPSDPSITKIWIIVKDPNGDDAAVYKADKGDEKKDLGLFEPNKGYVFELRYGRGTMVSRPGPSSLFTVPKKPGDFGMNDIITTLRPDAINVPIGTEDGRRFSYEFADPTIAEWLPETFQFKLKKVGTTTITVTTPESNLYLAASLTRTLIVGKGTQVLPTYSSGNITLTNESDKTKVYPATTNVGLTISYTSSNTNVATVDNNVVTFLSTGSVKITATQAGDDNYNSASTSFDLNVTITKANQTLTGVADLNKVFGDADFTLSVTTNSGLPLTFSSSDQSIASISGANIHIVQAGVVTITVSQAGNNSWNSISATFQLTINQGTHLLMLVTEDQYDYRYGMDPFALSPVTTAGIAVTYTSSDPSVLTIENFMAIIKKPGDVVISAHAAATQSYPELSGGVGLTIKKGLEFIDFDAINDQKIGASVVLNARARNQDQAAIITLSSAKGQMNGSTLKLVAAGKLSITASFASTTNYQAPTPLTQTICIAPDVPTIATNGLQLTSSADDNKWYVNGLLSGLTGKTITGAVGNTYAARSVVETCVSDLSAAAEIKAINPVTGLEDSEHSKITLYPNPASKILSVEGLEAGDNVRVLDGIGKQMLINTASSTTLELNVSDFAQGLYYVVIDNKQVVLKFLR